MRTIGTTGSIGGAAIIVGSLIAAPITGGLSIALLGGMGTAMSLGGAAVNIGTDVTEYFISKSFQNEFEKIVMERNDVSESLQKQFEKIFEQQSEIKKQIKDEDESLLLAFKCAKDNINIDSVSMSNILLRGISFQNIAQAKNFSWIFRSAGNSLWKGMRELSKSLRSVLTSLGVTTTRKAAMNIVRRGAIGLNIVFAVWDIKSIVDDWRGGNSTAEAMENSIKTIKSELSLVKHLIKIVNQI